MRQFLFLFLLSMFFYSCKAEIKCDIIMVNTKIDSSDYFNYKVKIGNILNDTDVSVSWFEFLLSKDFKEIYDDPINYLQLSIKYLKDTKNPKMGKKAVICSMQKNLNVDCFILFVEQCYMLFTQGLIDDELLYMSIVNILDDEHKIYNNYTNYKVKELLNKIFTDKRSSKVLKDAIFRILNQ